MNKNFIAKAKNGSGKSLALTIALLHTISKAEAQAQLVQEEVE